jgi:uncharacterized damage-inducible protein DinB
MRRRRWFERTFDLGHRADVFPDVLERLRGTPARLEDQLRGRTHDALVQRLEDRWTVQENVGHLGDLEPLWAGRLDDLLARENSLRPADLTNRRTEEAHHNDADIADLLGAFRAARKHLVDRLEALSDEQLRLSSFHPRLELQMNAVDLFFFVAEHDDHHLARITEILREVEAGEDH